MSVAESGTRGGPDGARLKAAILALACCATVIIAWACFLTIVSSWQGSRPLEFAVCAAAPAYLLARLGCRWSPVDSTLLVCLLIFMAWGAGFYFRPFPHKLPLLGASYLSPTSERIIYGIYAIFFVALGIKALRLSARASKAPEAVNPLRSPRAVVSFLAGALVIGVWVWTAIARAGSNARFPELWGITLILMIWASVSLLTFSFASSLGYDDRRPGVSRPSRPRWIGSWLMLVALWGAGIGARYVLHEPTPAYLLPNYNAHGAGYKNPFPKHQRSGDPAAPSNAGGDGQPVLNQP